MDLPLKVFKSFTGDLVLGADILEAVLNPDYLFLQSTGKYGSHINLKIQESCNNFHQPSISKNYTTINGDTKILYMTSLYIDIDIDIA